jgi:hypothetical protein
MAAPGAWVLSNETWTAAGKPFTGPVDTSRCGPSSSPKHCFDWLAGLGLRQHATYVPADRFWSLQWRESGLMLGLTALLTLVSVWWLRRRLT